MKPWIEASGVLISWLALATKSERIRSIITCSVCSRSAIRAPWPPSPRSTGSIRELNCLARSWLGLNDDAAGRGAGERPVDRREHAGVAQHAGERHWRCRAPRSCAGRRRWPGRPCSSWSTTMIGSGSASITERSIRCCAAIRPGLAAQLAAELAHRPQQPARQRALGFRRAAVAPGRAAGPRSRRRWPRAPAGARRRPRRLPARLSSQPSSATGVVIWPKAASRTSARAGRRAEDQRSRAPAHAR